MFQFTAFCLKWSRTCRGARMHCTFHSKLHSIEASRNEWNITPNVHNRLTNRAERAHLKHSFHHVCSSVFVQLNRLECVTERQCIMRWLAGRNAVHQWTTINYFGYFSSSHSIHIMMFFLGGAGLHPNGRPFDCAFLTSWMHSSLTDVHTLFIEARASCYLVKCSSSPRDLERRHWPTHITHNRFSILKKQKQTAIRWSPQT